MPLRAATIDGRPWLFERFLDFLPRRRVTLNAIWLEQAPEGWRTHRHAVPMRAWLPEDIDREARGLLLGQTRKGTRSHFGRRPILPR